MEKVKLSIIIVNYNTKELLENCLNSIFKSKANFPIELLVVDNKSSDRSAEMVAEKFPRVNLIINKKNLGFSKANNVALKIVQGEYILLLNSDTVLQEDTLAKMIDFMDKNLKVGASTCRVELPDGKLDKACRRGFSSPFNLFCYLTGLSKLFPKSKTFARYQMTFLKENETNEVDCIVGAFFLIRKEALDQVGLLDENFWMYGEDTDLCFRLKKVGWKIVYHPVTKIIHYKRIGFKKAPKKMIYQFHKSAEIFYKKHYAKEHSFVLNSLVLFAIKIKYYLALIKNCFKR